MVEGQGQPLTSATRRSRSTSTPPGFPRRSPFYPPYHPSGRSRIPEWMRCLIKVADEWGAFFGQLMWKRADYMAMQYSLHIGNSGGGSIPSQATIGIPCWAEPGKRTTNERYGRSVTQPPRPRRPLSGITSRRHTNDQYQQDKRGWTSPAWDLHTDPRVSSLSLPDADWPTHTPSRLEVDTVLWVATQTSRPR